MGWAGGAFLSGEDIRIEKNVLYIDSEQRAGLFYVARSLVNVSWRLDTPGNHGRRGSLMRHRRSGRGGRNL